ncbi:4a-hydroxytetrahydrobiopterin dehydratase [Oryzifoliimicrobium ureilyticus]|uniref:4a-hydroxytetrahydrobiopterin dehydratase n=1 Tax=Oryzifoliimicrobium ureilyticus TaxID=3113724 RepID=UPI0030766F85
MARRKFEEAEIKAELGKLHGWALADDAGSINKQFAFSNFPEAFAFMTEVALTAEKLDHHPDWRNVYSRVDVSLSTHDVGGLTELDFKLAHAADRAASRLRV